MDFSKITIPVAVLITAVITVGVGVVWGMERFPPRSAIEKLQEDMEQVKVDLAFLRGYLLQKEKGK